MTPTVLLSLIALVSTAAPPHTAIGEGSSHVERTHHSAGLVQGTFGLVSSLADGHVPGLFELRGGAAIRGFGPTMGFGYERVGPSGDYRGGYLHIGLQVRPMQMLAYGDEPVYRHIDLRGELALMLGGVGGPDDDLWLRAALALEVGVDLCLGNPEDLHAVVGVGYRYHATQRPEWAPSHYLMLSFGMRRAD